MSYNVISTQTPVCVIGCTQFNPVHIVLIVFRRVRKVAKIDYLSVRPSPRTENLGAHKTYFREISHTQSV